MLGINPAYLLPKGHYFAFFGGLGTISPYLGAVALQFGASPGLIGVIYATLPVFILVAKPSIGMLADAIQQRKLILVICVAIMFLSFFFIIFITPNEAAEPMSTGFLCNAQSSFLALCGMSDKEKAEYAKKSGQASCHFQCDMIANSSVSFESDVDLDGVTHDGYCSLYPLQTFLFNNQSQAVPVCGNETYALCSVSCSHGFLAETKDATGMNAQIGFLWILMITAYTGMATGTALADAIIIGILPNIGLYGRQRLFGPMGYGSLAMLTGVLVDLFSRKGKPINFKPCFILALILGTLDFVIVLRLTVKKSSRPENILRHVCRLFARPETLLFAVAVVCVGFFTGILWTFLIVYANILGGSQMLSGLIYGTQCFAGEIPFMFVSSWFLRKIGHGHAMTLVLAIFSVRFLLYSMVRNPWMILPIEVTQGITFGIFFTALATYSSLIAPPATHAAMQGILQGLFEGLGTGTGSLIGGMVFEAVGGSTMWLIMGLILGVLAIVHGIVLVMIQRKPKEKPAEEEEQPMAGPTEDADNSLPNIPE